MTAWWCIIMKEILADILKLLKEVETSDKSPETTLAVMKARLWAIYEDHNE
jgi:hypothetical protein